MIGKEKARLISKLEEKQQTTKAEAKALSSKRGGQRGR
jgi:hypothetical protein